MECASAVLVLEKAIPAFRAAKAMRERSSLLVRSCTSWGRHSRMSSMADMAKVSEIGLALTFQIDSKAWDSASRPVEMVTASGTVSISSGSMIAAVGQVQCRGKEYLRCWAEFQRVAQGVTSLPVPAVVGAAIRLLQYAGSGSAPPSTARN